MRRSCGLHTGGQLLNRFKIKVLHAHKPQQCNSARAGRYKKNCFDFFFHIEISCNRRFFEFKAVRYATTYFMKNKDAQYWVHKLQLIPHPEGGYYRETYRSDLNFSASVLCQQYSGTRCASTAIYFLLEKGQCSAFHRIRSDELWHFHVGDSMNIHMIDSRGEWRVERLGPRAEAGDTFQLAVPAGCWFAAEVIDKESFGLCSCTVAPGFEFDDFELADPGRLSKEYPQHRELIFRMAG